MSLVVEVSIDHLATTLAPLRGPRTDRATALAPLPLRVAPAAHGTYEVLDGFKRLARWRGEGHTHVPVVVEADAAPRVIAKARLLEANVPRRTLSPMDEARVVHSFVADDHLSPPQIVKLTGHGRGWVERRLILGRRLAPEVAAQVDQGRLSATTATALASVPRGEQKRLAEAIVRHGLRTREAEAFLAAWRVAADARRGKRSCAIPARPPRPSARPPSHRWAPPRANFRRASVRPSAPSTSSCTSISPACPILTSACSRPASAA